MIANRTAEAQEIRFLKTFSFTLNKGTSCLILYMTDIFRTYQVRPCIPVLVHEDKKIRSIVIYKMAEAIPHTEKTVECCYGLSS